VDQSSEQPRVTHDGSTIGGGLEDGDEFVHDRLNDRRAQCCGEAGIVRRRLQKHKAHSQVAVRHAIGPGELCERVIERNRVGILDQWRMSGVVLSQRGDDQSGLAPPLSVERRLARSTARGDRVEGQPFGAGL